MDVKKKILSLLDGSFTSLDDSSVPTSTIVRKAIRIARLRKDFHNLVWLDWEMADGTEPQARRAILLEAGSHFELKQLKMELSERERLVQSADAKSEEHESAMQQLQDELGRTKGEAAAKSKSQDALESELEMIRTASAEAMDEARCEMEDLKRQLSLRVRAVESEEARTSLRESAIEQLQNDLERVKVEAERKAKSEQALRSELERFKSASATAMEEARSEVEEME